MAQVKVDAPVIECEAVGYTECKWDKKPVSVRNDTVTPSSSSSSSLVASS